jgi:hypothetical protein
MKLNFGAQRHHYPMFDVGRSSLKPTPYGINAACVCLLNNLTLMGDSPGAPLITGKTPTVHPIGS